MVKNSNGEKQCELGVSCAIHKRDPLFIKGQFLKHFVSCVHLLRRYEKGVYASEGEAN